jgi:hypothetical protein
MESAMKLEYAITLDDFRALQKPFTLRPMANPGFKGAVFAAICLAALGIYCLFAGLGLPVAAFLLALAAGGGTAAYFFDVRSVRRAQEAYERNLSLGFERLHCRDRRIVEVTDAGYTLSCNCGTITRPWTELTQFSENQKFFLLRTKSEGLLLPKSAFSSEADRTEFRRLASEKINTTRRFGSTPIEFVCNSAEQRAARLLHIRQGGGWRLIVRIVLVLLGFFVILTWFLRSQGGSQNPAIPYESAAIVAGMFIAGNLARRFRRPAQPHHPLRLHFGNDGLHLEDQANIVRHPWESFCGYLENDGIFVLYHHPRLYRIIPKRVLGAKTADFANLVHSKLVPFNYRNPVRVPNPQVSNPAQTNS